MGAANTHLTHLEELVLTQGPQGYEMARAFLLELLRTLKGNTNSAIQTSVKWDGAPAIFAGVNPENGKFFVGTKSIFNKVPKINYTEEDIIKNHGHAPGLVDKLTKALKYLPQLGITNILQGDFMFDDEMLDVVNIEGEPHYRFKPNTIVYAVPVDSQLGQEIGQSKFGIVFHTTYDSLDSGASFGADVSNLNRAPGVWFDDAFFTDDTGTVTLTEDEEQRIISLVKEADGVNKEIDYNDLPMAMLNIYINSEIKSGQFIEDPENSYNGFIDWYTGRTDAAINKLKTPRGQERKRGQQQQTLELFENKKRDILNLFRVSRLLFEAKNIFIEKYNNAVYNTKHFVDDGSGDLTATNPEGYVAVDHSGNGVKFVDRLEFSRANFAVDKSSKFVQERTLTIQVSKDKQITKTLSEWLTHARNAGHTYQKPPQFVYKDIMAGTPIVEIVSQENAEKTIYNAVITYANNLIEESKKDFMNDKYTSDPYPPPIPVLGEDPNEINLDIEDEDEDPVIDIDFEDEPKQGKTIAVVPGAFKPPHNGHLDMVQKYADIADEVKIIISTPTLSGRYITTTGPDGKKEKREITADDSLQIWKLLTVDMPNVEVDKSSHASPINAAYEYVGQDGPLNIGDKVILGCSAKDCDWKRWTGAEKYIKDGVELLTPKGTAVTPMQRQDDVPFSATDFRNALSNPNNKDEIAEFVGKENVDNVLKILGLSTELEEASTASGGSSPGAPVGADGSPWVNGQEIKKDNKKEKERSKLVTRTLGIAENNTIDEVMRLIMERGILR